MCAALLMALGCGADPEPWEGDWIVVDGDCGVALTLKPGTYTAGVVCVGSSPAQLETETGALQVSGNVLTFTPKRGTCPGPQPPYTATWARNGATLAVGLGAQVLLLERNHPTGTTTGTVTLGCFQGGTFVPRAPADY